MAASTMKMLITLVIVLLQGLSIQTENPCTLKGSNIYGKRSDHSERQYMIMRDRKRCEGRIWCGNGITFVPKCRKVWGGCEASTSGIVETACQRFENCAPREKWVNEDDVPCIACIDGFRLTSAGYCTQDEDECIRDVCQPNGRCVNTHGSFHCVCDHGYKVNAAGSHCQALQCEEPSLPSGEVISDSDDEWMFESHAFFDCTSDNKVLVGPAYLTCELDAVAEQASWSGNYPSCENDRVRDRTAQVFHVRYHGYQLEGVSLDTGVEPSSAAYSCVNAQSCDGIVVHTEDIEDGQLHNSGLLRKPLAHLISKGKNLRPNDHVDIYTKLKFRRGHRYSDILAKAIGASTGCYSMESLSTWEESRLQDGAATSCNRRCLKSGYEFFAVQQSARNCLCGKVQPGVSVSDSECSTPCRKQESIMCGGSDTASVYRVHKDNSLGYCYSGNLGGRPIRGATTDDDCINQCRGYNARYAHIRSGGGRCFCGNDLPETPNVEDTFCSAGTNGYTRTYSADPALNMIVRRKRSAYKVTTKMFDSGDSVTGMTTDLFKKLPGLRIFTSKRLVLYSDEDVEFVDAPDEYESTCGEIARVDGEADIGGDRELHFYYLRTSALSSYTSNNAKRVHIYAQTVVIDSDIDVPFSLLIRATKIAVVPRNDFKITVSHDAPALDINIPEIRDAGPARNLQHMKDSIQCARMLMISQDSSKVDTAFSILYELMNPPATNAAEKTVQTVASSLKIQLEGMMKNNIHHVPSYTIAYYGKLLASDSEIVDDYDDRLQLLKLGDTTETTFLSYAQELGEIYEKTSIMDAENQFDDAMKVYDSSTAIYRRLQTAYDEGYDTLMRAVPIFTQAIREKVEDLKFRRALMFLDLFVNALQGGIQGDPGAVVSSLKDSFIDISDNGASSIWGIESVVNNINDFTAVLDGNLNALMNKDKPYDGTRYTYVIERVATMHKTVLDWENFQIESSVIFADEDIFAINGAGDYGRAIVKLTNLGKALTKAMIDKAELTRQAALKRSTLDLLREQQQRTSQAIASFNQDRRLRAAAESAVGEQIRDLTSQVNDNLASFCQAYFFERLETCPDDMQPRFGSDLLELRQRINRAQKEVPELNLNFRPVSRTIAILNTDDSTDCEDVTKCPITFFKKNRAFAFKVPIGHRELEDYDQYRVEEVEIKALGAEATGRRKDLKFFVTSTGFFKSKSGSTTYNFLTDEFFGTYEYNVETGEVVGQCKIYESDGAQEGMTSYMTPYTNWMIQVDDRRSSTIDLSNVHEIEMKFIGSGVPVRY